MADVVELWFDERGQGDGPPVVLLHGGMCTADTWAMQADAFAASRRVLMPEQRGHGHTRDPGPLTYELMAGDTIAFLEAHAGGPADLVGWSDGGNVGLLVASQRPDLVRKLVTIGSNFHHEGTLPAFLVSVEEDGGAMLKPAYDAVSPDGPDHWPVVIEKLTTMWRTGPTMTADDLGRIEAPVLVMAGDDDCIHFEHTLALYGSVPHGQLAVIPGTSHLVPIEKPALVNQLILDFLDDGSVVGMFPMRRAHA
jgi:pimeloyl-ACP methyl ester carboxylesterase